MKRNNDYDEKQLLERGKAYRNGYFTLLALMLAVYFIKDGLELHWLDGISLFHVFFWGSFAVSAITMIVKDAFDGISGNGGMFVLSLIGFSGLVTLVVTAVKLILGKELFTASVGDIVMGVCCVTVACVYWAKRAADKKMENS